MFPIYVKDAEALPESAADPIYYIVASNGLFLVKQMELYRACVQVDSVPWLLPQAESLHVKLPKIPQALVEACMGFFYAAFQRYHSEAIVLLYCSAASGFTVGVPKQHVRYQPQRGFWGRSYHVDYDNLPTPEGLLRVGTWHSHADLPAYHSYHDDLDEAEEDGLHIVCGDLDTPRPSFSVSFMANGKRFILERDDVFEGYEQPTLPPPEEWLAQVVDENASDPSGGAGVLSSAMPRISAGLRGRGEGGNAPPES